VRVGGCMYEREIYIEVVYENLQLCKKRLVTTDFTSKVFFLSAFTYPFMQTTENSLKRDR
jgi:hypothetical protein